MGSVVFYTCTFTLKVGSVSVVSVTIGNFVKTLCLNKLANFFKF